eukprot:scaffold2926_cov247-Pinguiococcus_pyrenoidosus.AAC.5
MPSPLRPPAASWQVDELFVFIHDCLVRALPVSQVPFAPEPQGYGLGLQKQSPQGGELHARSRCAFGLCTFALCHRSAVLLRARRFLDQRREPKVRDLVFPLRSLIDHLVDQGNLRWHDAQQLSGVEHLIQV